MLRDDPTSFHYRVNKRISPPDDEPPRHKRRQSGTKPSLQHNSNLIDDIPVCSAASRNTYTPILAQSHIQSSSAFSAATTFSTNISTHAASTVSSVFSANSTTNSANTSFSSTCSDVQSYCNQDEYHQSGQEEHVMQQFVDRCEHVSTFSNEEFQISWRESHTYICGIRNTYICQHVVQLRLIMHHTEYYGMQLDFLKG